jgi:hypothetical protein
MAGNHRTSNKETIDNKRVATIINLRNLGNNYINNMVRNQGTGNKETIESVRKLTK